MPVYSVKRPTPKPKPGEQAAGGTGTTPPDAKKKPGESAEGSPGGGKAKKSWGSAYASKTQPKRGRESFEPKKASKEPGGGPIVEAKGKGPPKWKQEGKAKAGESPPAAAKDVTPPGGEPGSTPTAGGGVEGEPPLQQIPSESSEGGGFCNCGWITQPPECTWARECDLNESAKKYCNRQAISTCECLPEKWIGPNEYLDYGMVIPADEWDHDSEAEMEGGEGGPEGGEGKSEEEVFKPREVDPAKAEQAYDEVGGGQDPISAEKCGKAAQKCGFAPSKDDIQDLKKKKGDKVSKKDFVDWLQKDANHPSDDVKHMTELFRFYDRGHTGKLSKKQISNLLSQYGEPLSQQEIDAIFTYEEH